MCLAVFDHSLPQLLPRPEVRIEHLIVRECRIAALLDPKIAICWEPSKPSNVRDQLFKQTLISERVLKSIRREACFLYGFAPPCPVFAPPIVIPDSSDLLEAVAAQSVSAVRLGSSTNLIQDVLFVHLKERLHLSVPSVEEHGLDVFHGCSRLSGLGTHQRKPRNTAKDSGLNSGRLVRRKAHVFHFSNCPRLVAVQFLLMRCKDWAMESSSIWIKFRRATEHLEALKKTIAIDVASYGERHTVTDGSGKERLDLLEPTPLIALFAGEFIYQLRSTLDHLAFDLVQQNLAGANLPVNWEQDCAFPIWCDPLKPGQKTPLPIGTFKRLPGITTEAHTLIERVQPYYPPGTGSVNNYLRLLNALSNIDKHRRFALTRTRAIVRHRVIYASGITGDGWVTLDNGEEVPTLYGDERDPIVDVERRTTLTIAFDERLALGDATTVPVDTLLEGMLPQMCGKK